MAATAIGGTIGALVCSPAYVIGRIGILLLGSKALFPLAVFLLVVGFALQAGALGRRQSGQDERQARRRGDGRLRINSTRAG